METLADRIRHLLKIRGVDQRTLAKRAGLSSSYVSVFLSHARENPQAGMSADRLYALAETWGADPQWLLQGKGASADASGVHSRSELLRDRAASRSHGEGDATRTAQAFAFPRPTVHRVLARHGWDIAEAVAICPTLPVLWAILRLAWVAERGVVVTPPRTRIPVVWAPEGIVLPPWDAWALDARSLTKTQRAPTGVEVVSYVDDRDETWTVSVLPPAHEDAAWLRLHAILRVV